MGNCNASESLVVVDSFQNSNNIYEVFPLLRRCEFPGSYVQKLRSALFTDVFAVYVTLYFINSIICACGGMEDCVN